MERINFSLLSISRNSVIPKVLISDGSERGDFEALRNITKKYPFVKHYHNPIEEFNKPVLYNLMLDKIETPWTMFTDCDYLFRKDFFKSCQRNRKEDCFMMKEVRMLPAINVNTTRIHHWDFPDAPFNFHGHLANGACQYALTDWFRENPYDQRMSSHGAMDNMQKWIALANGLKEKWMTESEILHQHHKIYKFKTSESRNKFARNIKFVRAYKQEHQL